MEAIKERFPAPVDPSSAGRGGPLPVFVLGVSRSGKTLVETLLASHPGVHPAGEGGQLANALKAAADRHALPDALLPVIDALDGSRIEEVGGAYMAAATVEAPGAGWFVNTAPGYVEALGLIMRGLPAARVVHCQRDPLDAGLLIYFSRYRTGNAHAYDLDDIASYVADYRSLMAHWRHLYADRILDVAYEDLVRDPAPEAARIFAFCGLEPPPPAVGEDLTTDEVGHWKHYAAHLGALRRAFETADGADD
jgi:hypothetical protein